MGVILYPIAFILNIIATPIAIIWGMFRCENISNYFYKIDVSIDVKGNIVAQYLFNDILIKSDGYKFGTEGETISYVLNVNLKNNTLTEKGKFVSLILKNKFKDSAFTDSNQLN